MVVTRRSLTPTEAARRIRAKRGIQGCIQDQQVLDEKQSTGETAVIRSNY
jgi:hypothetical protein